MRFSRIVHYSFKTLAYGLCALGCGYQVISIFNIYFSFPTTVFSFIEIMEKLTLPAISICNNNRIMLSKLRAYDIEFDQSWIRFEKQLQKKRKVHQTKLDMQQLIDQKVRQLMDSLSVSEFAQLGHEWEDFISEDFFKCATDPFNLNNKCLKYANVIKSAQEEGNCFTIFRNSGNDFLQRIAIKSGLSQSPVIRGIEDALNLEIAEQSFHPNELVRIMVNFSITDYTNTNEPVMGFLMVHDQNELPPIREKNFIIYPGHFYEIYVNKEIGKYLPKPYVTDCVNYEVKKKETDTKHAYLPSVLSRETCIMNCMGQQTVERCDCWPPELPYILDNSTEHKLKWCSWRDGANIALNHVNKSDNSNWFQFCFANNEKNCNKQCKMQCQVDRYDAIRQTFAWPSKQRMEHSTKFNKEYRKCCAIVSVRFWSAEQETQKYEPKYEFVEFFAYFGGLLSIWLGFSLVKTYDVFEVIANKSFTRCRKEVKTNPVVSKRKLTRPSKKLNRPRVAKYYQTKHKDNSTIQGYSSNETILNYIH